MIVVDCSAVVDALVVAPGTDELRTMLATEDLHAPHLLDAEVVSALRGLTLGGHLGEPRALDALADLEDLPMTRWAMPDHLRRRAFSLRDNLSAYDASYVALAESLECRLLTRDARLAAAIRSEVRVLVL